jgi:hypothetical protein
LSSAYSIDLYRVGSGHSEMLDADSALLTN